MKMMNFARGALGAAALLLGLSQARADYSVNPATASSPLTVCGFSVSNVLLPCHVMVNSGKVELFTATNPGMVGLAFGGSALSLGQATAAKSLPVVLPSNPDILNAAATLTAADGASASLAGQNAVPVITGTPTAGSVYNIPINGQSEAVFTIGNVFVGTLQFETSGNGGLTWTPRAAQIMGTKYRQTQVTGPGMFRINSASLTNVRVRVIALTSGTPSVQLNTTAGTGSVEVMNDIEIVDNSTGLSPSVKAGGAAALTDPAMTVQNPNEAAALTALNTAIGDCTAAAYAGSGTGTLCSVLKGVFGQAPASGAAGSTPPNGASIGYVQLVPGAQPQPVDTVVKTTATPRSLILPVQGASDTPAAGGASNSVGDVLTAIGGTNTTPFKCTVSSVSSGAVTGCTPLAGSLGSYTALPSNPVATTSSGSGSGTTLTVTYAGLAVQVAPANASRRALHVQAQGGVAYMNGIAAATADQNSLKIPADALFTTDPQVVGTGAVSMITAGSLPLPVYSREY